MLEGGDLAKPIGKLEPEIINNNIISINPQHNPYNGTRDNTDYD